jgi:glycosyltransferase involved in cell wall biosynthesis
MSLMPLITAIIPAYNGVSRYLEQAIRSALEQSVAGDMELIVIDDASTDGTEELVKQRANVRYVRRTTNGGQAAARNEGARLAKGKFLAFLDQDDLWEPTLLKEALEVMFKYPDAAVVHADGFQVNEHNDIMHYDAAMKHTGSITQMLRGGHDVATSGSLFRKACFDTVSGYDEQLTIWEDIDLAIRLYQQFSLIHLPNPLYRHRLYGHNASRDIPSERALLGRQRFLEKHGPTCGKGTREAAALIRDWAHYYGDLGKHLLRQGLTTDARQAFRRAIACSPFDYKLLLRLLRSYFRG